MVESAKGSRAPDRPRERLARLGPASLSEAELLALVLRTGSRCGDALSVAQALLDRVGDLDALLSAIGPELEQIAGLGEAKVASLRATFEIARRVPRTRIEQGEPIGGPIDVHRHFSPRLLAARRESFHVLLLDGRHRLIAEREVSVGTLTASLVHPREVFRDAIRFASAALLLVHNHPSGDPTPSAEDRAVSERLRDAGELIGIRVVDHVIVASGGHFSFREAGLCFGSSTGRAAREAVAASQSAVGAFHDRCGDWPHGATGR